MKILDFSAFWVFYEQLNFHAQLSMKKKVYNLRTCTIIVLSDDSF